MFLLDLFLALYKKYFSALKNGNLATPASSVAADASASKPLEVGLATPTITPEVEAGVVAPRVEPLDVEPVVGAEVDTYSPTEQSVQPKQAEAELETQEAQSQATQSQAIAQEGAQVADLAENTTSTEQTQDHKQK